LSCSIAKHKTKNNFLNVCVEDSLYENNYNLHVNTWSTSVYAITKKTSTNVDNTE